MNNDVCAVLNRTDEIGCAEGIVDHKRKFVLVCDFRNCVYIGNITVRIAERL